MRNIFLFIDHMRRRRIRMKCLELAYEVTPTDPATIQTPFIVLKFADIYTNYVVNGRLPVGLEDDCKPLKTEQ